MKQQTKILGIINITPDSFSDGGLSFTPKEAAEKAVELAKSGADIIDLGAESTRPGADEISDYEEILRLIPVIKELKSLNFETPISVDTRKFNVAKKACELGIDYLNDVSGFNDERMIDLVRQHDIKAIFMHSLSIPADKNLVIDEREDVVLFLKKWATEKIDRFISSGIKKDRLIFDPGIGFGKTSKQSFEIIKRIDEFRELGVDMLIGHSEKSFLTLFTDKPAGKRNIETNAVTYFLAQKNVEYIRVHNAEEAKRTMKIAQDLIF